jgi:ABC-type phosphate transport system substrate-binding protein
MKIFTYTFAAALLIVSVPVLQGADFKVIANSSVGASEASADDLKAVFLGTKSSLGDGSRVTPVLEKGGTAHDAFLSKCIGKTDSALTAYYRSLVFTGKGSMPKTLASDAEVAEYVSKTKGAIGYVSASAATPGVKTVEVK